jgi:UPF0716 family protein affecting phage T7 exclusion
MQQAETNDAVFVKMRPSWIGGWAALLLVVMASMAGLSYIFSFHQLRVGAMDEV